MNIADMLIELYVAESTLLRARKIYSKYGEQAAALKLDMARVYIYDCR